MLIVSYPHMNCVILLDCCVQVGVNFMHNSAITSGGGGGGGGKNVV